MPIQFIWGDRVEPMEEVREDCRCINPGPFSAPDFGFVLYYPTSDRTVFR